MSESITITPQHATNRPMVLECLLTPPPPGKIIISLYMLPALEMTNLPERRSLSGRLTLFGDEIQSTITVPVMSPRISRTTSSAVSGWAA